MQTHLTHKDLQTTTNNLTPHFLCIYVNKIKKVGNIDAPF